MCFRRESGILGQGGDDGNVEPNQIFDERFEAIVVAVGPPVFDRDVTARHVLRFGKAFDALGSVLHVHRQ